MASPRGTPELLAMTMLGFSGYAVLLPVAPLWVVSGGAGTAGAGAVNGVLLLVTILTQPVVPRLLQRWGWGVVMSLGVLLLGLPSLAHLLGDGLALTLTLSAVRGVGFGFLTVTGSAAVAELVAPERRGRAIGAYGLAIALPQLVLLPAAPWVAETLGFWVVFLVGACPVLAVVPALALGRTLDGLPRAPHDAGRAVTRRAAYLPLLRPVTLLLGVTLVGGGLLTFIPQATSSAALTMVALLMLTATAALARWRFGALADRFGVRPFLAPLVLVTTLGVGLIAWSVREPSDTTGIALVAGMAVVGACYGGLQSLTLVAAFRVVARRDYGVASAVWNMGFDAGTGLGAVIVGMIAAGSSFTHALLVAGLLALLTLPFALGRGRRDLG
ncbi:MFS transporter [Nocardioides sp.]|uniref:MFS transporter n=1 Tax=Nocardioides sp. TaxID=35761 RepID=UPI0027351359|nr:MFS transporter [Nocardioides sp.]MDP3893669.1 MFS transporter [Nocardioides sp.]